MNDMGVDLLRERLLYDPSTGLFTWRVTAGSRRALGDAAGTVDSRGYLVIRVGGKQRSAHRLAWLYVHGVWPDFHIDHIDGNKLNNRIANLRDVSVSVNLQNQKRPRSNSSSGLLGVSLCRQTGKWLAGIGINGRRKALGRFDSPEQAHAVYLEAKRRLHAGCTI